MIIAPLFFVVRYNKKVVVSSSDNDFFGGEDEARTRDPMRDRHVF